MLLCVIDADDVPEKLDGCFLIGELTVHIEEARDPGQAISGFRADQILCRLWDFQNMERIGD